MESVMIKSEELNYYLKEILGLIILIGYDPNLPDTIRHRANELLKELDNDQKRN